MRRLGVAILAFALLGCGERKTSKGWAAQVPDNAIRYVDQPVEPKVETIAPQPAVEPAVQAVPKAYAAEIAEPVEITLWHAYRSEERRALERVVDSFHALGTNVTIKLRMVPFDAFNDKIKVVVPEGRGPDLFIFAHDLIGAWAEMGFLEPLNQWTRPEHTAPFLGDTVKALVYRNSLYGLPMAFKCVALFYNKALVKQPPRTMEALVALAKQHTNEEEDRFGLLYESTNLYFHAPWVHGFGGQVLDARDESHADEPAALAALKLAHSLVKEHAVVPTGVNTSMVSGYFNDGLAAMAINGPWMRGEIEGVDYGVALLPDLANGEPARPFLGVESVFLNKHSEKKAAAFEVMRYLTSDESAVVRAKVGAQPVPNRVVWDKGDVDDAMLAFRKQMDRSVVMPSSPRMQQVWTPYNAALLAVLAGEKDPAEALKNAQARIEQDMARAGGGSE